MLRSGGRREGGETRSQPSACGGKVNRRGTRGGWKGGGREGADLGRRVSPRSGGIGGGKLGSARRSAPGTARGPSAWEPGRSGLGDGTRPAEGAEPELRPGRRGRSRLTRAGGGGRARAAAGARLERAAPPTARACLPAHVGVVFKWNAALAARERGGSREPPR